MSIVSELEKILEDEQRHLLTGNFDGLQSLVEKKTRLATRLAKKKPELSGEIYQELSRKAAQNEALLDAARRGLQSAMSQLKQLSDGESQKTYSKEGFRTSLSRKPNSLIQKI